MPDVSFVNLLVVVAVAVLAPLAVGYLPRLRVPAVVLEIVGGIIIGPSVLGWVHVDLPVAILALFGLAFLLFLAGLEIDVHHLRGRLLRFALLGYLVTLVLGYGAGASFTAIGWVSQPLLLAIALSATSLGLVVPVLKDAGQLPARWGRARWPRRASPTSGPSSCCRCSSPPRAGVRARRSWCSARSRDSSP